MSLGEGPLIVDANIWPPSSVSCKAVEVPCKEAVPRCMRQSFLNCKDRLRSSPTLSETIQSWMAGVPSLDELASSPIKVPGG